MKLLFVLVALFATTFTYAGGRTQLPKLELTIKSQRVIYGNRKPLEAAVFVTVDARNNSQPNKCITKPNRFWVLDLGDVKERSKTTFNLKEHLTVTVKEAIDRGWFKLPGRLTLEKYVDRCGFRMIGLTVDFTGYAGILLSEEDHARDIRDYEIPKGTWNMLGTNLDREKNLYDLELTLK